MRRRRALIPKCTDRFKFGDDPTTICCTNRGWCLRSKVATAKSNAKGIRMAREHTRPRPRQPSQRAAYRRGGQEPKQQACLVSDTSVGANHADDTSHAGEPPMIILTCHHKLFIIPCTLKGSGVNTAPGPKLCRNVASINPTQQP